MIDTNAPKYILHFQPHHGNGEDTWVFIDGQEAFKKFCRIGTAMQLVGRTYLEYVV